MNVDLISLQAVIIGAALLLVILLRNSWCDRARRKREADAETNSIASTDKGPFSS